MERIVVELQQQQNADRYEEFLRLFTQERERMFAFIYSMIPRQADAEDVFQRSSLVLWRKFHEFRQGEDFLAWACGGRSIVTPLQHGRTIELGAILSMTLIHLS